MKFEEALTSMIDEQSTGNRDVFIATDTNTRLAGVIMGQVLNDDHLYQREEVEYGTFSNCREYGLTVSLGGWTFSVYEHRNSDAIIINGCRDEDVQEYGPYSPDGDKWDYFAALRYDKVYEAGELLSALIDEAQSPLATRDKLKKFAQRRSCK